MLKTELLNHLQSGLSQLKNKQIQVTGFKQVFGGDINTTYTITSNEDKYFIKLNTITFTDMLQKEKEGLLLLRSASNRLKIPEPLLQGTFKQQSFLLIE